MDRFVTVFPQAHDFHLIKDVGQLPWFMGKFHGYDAQLACYRNDKEYKHTKGEVKGLQLEFFEKKGAFLFVEKGVMKYLKKEARQIDVLHLFHFSKSSFVYGLYYKLLNPSGKLYLKADVYNPHLSEDGLKYSNHKFKNGLFKYLEWKFLQKADLITVENKAAVDLMEEKYPYAKEKVRYLPNGVNDVFLKKHFSEIKTFDEKENIILVSGRIGIAFKKHQFILEAASKLNFKDWKIVFVGPVEDTFRKIANEFHAVHPHLKDKVIFTGEVHNRKELYEWYNRSKICCLTSVELESFGLVYPESMYFGNYIIGTETMSAFDDLSNKGEYGDKLPAGDIEMLSNTLQRYIDDDEKLRKCFPAIRQYCLDNFLWSVIFSKLNEYIRNAG